MPKPKRDKQAGSQPHLKRPDLDNLVKAVTDSLNGILYCDDCQFFRCEAIKRYSEDPRRVGVIVNASLFAEDTGDDEERLTAYVGDGS